MFYCLVEKDRRFLQCDFQLILLEKEKKKKTSNYAAYLWFASSPASPPYWALKLFFAILPTSTFAKKKVSLFFFCQPSGSAEYVCALTWKYPKNPPQDNIWKWWKTCFDSVFTRFGCAHYSPLRFADSADSKKKSVNPWGAKADTLLLA